MLKNPKNFGHMTLSVFSSDPLLLICNVSRFRLVFEHEMNIVFSRNKVFSIYFL